MRTIIRKIATCLTLSAACSYPISANANPVLTLIGAGIGEVPILIGKFIDLFDIFKNEPAYGQDHLLLTFSETNDFLTFGLIGDALDRDAKGTFVLTGNYWTVQFAIDEDNWNSTFDPNDKLSINGFVQHTVGPHKGDGPFGPLFHYNFAVNADNVDTGLVSMKDTGKDTHPGIEHEDIFSADLTATVKTGGAFNQIDDITGYTFDLKANHIPEPSTLILIGAGIIGLSLTVKRKMG